MLIIEAGPNSVQWSFTGKSTATRKSNRLQYEDAKAIARIEPAISKLGVWGITKLGEIVRGQHDTIVADSAKKEQQRLLGENPPEPAEEGIRGPAGLD